MDRKATFIWGLVLAAPFTTMILDLLNQLGDILLQIINFILGTTGAPVSQVIFAYALPGLLMYFIIYDFIYLMGFFRKQTAWIISLIFALFGARFGVYNQIIAMIQTFMGSSATGSGLWIPILTFIFILMAFWWMVGHFLWGFRFAQNTWKSTETIDAGLGYLGEIGTYLETGSKAEARNAGKKD